MTQGRSAKACVPQGVESTHSWDRTVPAWQQPDAAPLSPSLAFRATSLLLCQRGDHSHDPAGMAHPAAKSAGPPHIDPVAATPPEQHNKCVPSTVTTKHATKDTHADAAETVSASEHFAVWGVPTAAIEESASSASVPVTPLLRILASHLGRLTTQLWQQLYGQHLVMPSTATALLTANHSNASTAEQVTSTACPTDLIASLAVKRQDLQQPVLTQTQMQKSPDRRTQAASRRLVLLPSRMWSSLVRARYAPRIPPADRDQMHHMFLHCLQFGAGESCISSSAR